MESKIARDIVRLKEDGGASAKEMREFVGRLRGKNPQEVLGMVAQSSLVNGVVLATLLTVGGIALFTVGPYLLAKGAPAKEPVAATAPSTDATSADKPAETATNSAAPVETDPAAAPKTTDAAQPNQPSTEILEKLEMDEVKESDPTSNPLEEKEDDLLKDLR